MKNKGLKRFFIIGYYGSSNLGDELLLSCTKKLIMDCVPEAELTALTYNVKGTESLHGIKGVSRNHYKEIVSAIKANDVIVGGGGSMLQNVTSNRSLMYYLMLLFISKCFGKKVLLLGNGIGPIQGNFWKWLTALLLNHIDQVVVRDEESHQALQQMGVTQNVKLGSDLVFTYEALETQARNPKKVTLNLRPWKNEEGFLAVFEAFVHDLLDQGYEVVLVPLQVGFDDRVLRALHDRIRHPGLSLLPCEPIEDIISSIASSKVFIGMRLHSLILSALVETPFVGISYDPKVNAFTTAMGQGHIENLDQLTLERLRDQFQKVLDQEESYLAQLEKGRETAKYLAEVNRTVMKKLIQGELNQ